MGNKTRKATFNLHSSVLADLEKAMVEGAAPSKNAFVEQALVKELEELKRKRRQSRWQQGAADTLLIDDIHEIEAGFEIPDNETAGRLDQ